MKKENSAHSFTEGAEVEEKMEICNKKIEIMDERFENIICDALYEINKQDSKWGKNRKKHPLEWQCILLEEVGEVAKEICDTNFQPEANKNYREELIQVMAVTMQALLNYDRNLNP